MNDMSAVAVVFSEGTSRLLLNRCIFYRLMFKDVYATATIAAISIISAVYMNMSAVFNHNVWAYCTPLMVIGADEPSKNVSTSNSTTLPEIIYAMRAAGTLFTTAALLLRLR